MIIGAYGSVSLCSIIGAIAMGKGISDSTGMVSSLPFFSHLKLANVSDFVFGGWDIRDSSLVKSARDLYSITKSLPLEIYEGVKEELEQIEDNISVGTGFGLEKLLSRFEDVNLVEETAAQALARIESDIEKFKLKNNIDKVIVVNLASTEPLTPVSEKWNTIELLNSAIEEGDTSAILPNILYAYAALKQNCQFINFTPSVGSEIPALRNFAMERGLVHTGKDGKTGETLIKTVLAPMFVARNFKVHAWQGYNMLGNRDGLILDDPGSNSAKTANKDRVLKSILGNENFHTQTRIDYVPSLDDWKVAWDFIHFQGFLGTNMTMTFLWQGCDSMLAAPLVLDLIRFVNLEADRGSVGIPQQLAVFYKNPILNSTMDFFEQFRALVEHYTL